MELDAGNLRKQLDTLGTESLSNLNSSLLDFQTGAKSGSDAIKDFEKQFLRSLLSMMNQMIIIAPLAKSLQSLLGGFLPFGNYNNATGPAPPSGFVASALGNSFANGNITPFARGGIVDRPTIFPMARGYGLMGEAGPEAVMPLRRLPSGRLGVEGGGGRSGPITMHMRIDLQGANGDATIERISRQAAMAAATAVVNQYNRNLPDRMNQLQMEGR
jgi:lambda family phage tail tape measure protein